ncbi:hypothetical protein GGI15_001152 [Coemansia interrupta]|uniref:MFS general substrate transporter n=1 Tax=Coemansia interrupta TaxID=1126814 RepID=A0A9W8HIJ1_9FUNG|nr:hypothetical protein GGI15_001152 [Coemansia interrupta]
MSAHLLYNSPMVQVIIMSIACFLCPGMFNALNAIGGAGQVDRTVANYANTGIYCMFIVSGVFGGAVVNLTGIRWSMFVSGLTYSLYSASYIYLNHTGKGAFTIATGPILGIGAGVLWSAQGMVIMSYPSQDKKGRYISVFWAIFNMGGVVGGIVPFISNFDQGNSHTAVPLSSAAYIVFVALEATGALFALFLAPPKNVIRGDGSYAVLGDHTGVYHEVVETLKVFQNRWMLLLIPMCIVSNFSYSYQWGAYNGSIFTLRTRGLNSMLYWTSQVLAAYVASLIHDCQHLSRRGRGIISLLVVTVLANIMWGTTLVLQRTYTHGPVKDLTTDYPGGLIDFGDPVRAAGPIMLYCFMGAVDALWQSLAYWLIGATTNDSQALARYAGFYKGMQSLGAVIAWQLDAHSVSFMTQLIVNWVIMCVAVPPMGFVAYMLKEQPYNVDPVHNDNWLYKPQTSVSYI